ncbi:hypothetical protein ACF8C6_11985 [Pseudomonas sp. zbq_18]|uniref:hypothetical protein n=1 Tax=Pseudomonas sp. zbq_18 TaxID=3367251 RepID=UPI00370BC2D8
MRAFSRVTLFGLLIVLIGLAESTYSHSASGVVQLFLFSLFVSLGFLLFGAQRFEAKPPGTP